MGLRCDVVAAVGYLVMLFGFGLLVVVADSIAWQLAATAVAVGLIWFGWVWVQLVEQRAKGDGS